MKRMQSLTGSHLLRGSLAVAMLAGGALGADAQIFNDGNLVISGVSSSATLTSAATQVLLSEYRVNGITTGNTYAFPGTSSALNLTNSGSAASEGQLSLQGNYLAIGGYNATIGTSAVAGTLSTAVNRVVGVVNYKTGSTSITSLGNAAFSGNNIRGAVSNGTNIWAAGTATVATSANGGIFTTTVGSTTNATQVSNTVTNTRHVDIYNGQLYFSTGAGTTGIYAVGSGTPTASGTTSTLAASAATSPYDFAFADTNTLFVADSVAGIQKYTRASTAVSFSLAYTVTVGTGYTGLTIAQDTNGNNVLFAVSPTTLSRFTDLGTGAADNSSIVTLATAPTNTAFRGVRFLGTGRVAAGTPAPSALLPIALGVPMIAFRLRRRRK